MSTDIFLANEKFCNKDQNSIFRRNKKHHKKLSLTKSNKVFNILREKVIHMKHMLKIFLFPYFFNIL